MKSKNSITRQVFRVAGLSLLLAVALSFGLSIPAYGIGGDLLWPTGTLRDAKTGQQTPAATVLDYQGNVIIGGYQVLKTCSGDSGTFCSTNTDCSSVSKGYCSGSGSISQFYVIKVNTVTAGSPTVAWSATLGRCSNSHSTICTQDLECGSGNYCNAVPPSPGDQILAVAADRDGNVIVAGSIHDNTFGDRCQVVKYDASAGTTLWKQTYTTGQSSCTAIAVEEGGTCSTGSVCSGNNVGRICSTDVDCNDIYVGGYTGTGAGGDEDFLIFKFNSAGALQSGWPVTYNNTLQSDTDRIATLAWTGSGVAAAGYSRRGICSGDSSTSCTSSSSTTCQSAGKGTCNMSNFDFLTIVYGTDGSIQSGWPQLFPGSGRGDDGQRRIVKVDSGGNIIVTGPLKNSAGSRDIYTIKYAPTGNAPLASWAYSSGYDNVPKAMFVDNARDIYVTGYATRSTSSTTFYTAKYDGSSSNGSNGLGTKVWETVGLTSNSYTATAAGIALDTLGDVIVTGYENNLSTGGVDWLTVKYKGSSGDVLWQTTYDDAAHKDDYAMGALFSVTCTGSPGTSCSTDAWCSDHSLGTCGNLYVVGWSDAWTSSAQDYDYYVINYDRGLLNPPTGLKAAAGVCQDNTASCTQDADCGGAAGSCVATKVKLAWHVNSTNETDFCIERKQGEFGTWPGSCTATAATGTNKMCSDYSKDCLTDDECTSPATCTAIYYIDSGLTANSYYYYRIRAHSSSLGQYSNYSNVANALTMVVSYSAPAGVYLYDNPSGYVCKDKTGVHTTTSCPNRTNADCIAANISGGTCDTTVANEFASAITASPDDNVVATGYRVPTYLLNEWFTVKLKRDDMTSIWSGYYGESDREYEAVCVAADNNGNAIVSGSAEVVKGCFSGSGYLQGTGTLNYSGLYPSSGEMLLWTAQYNNPFQQNVDPVAISTAGSGICSDGPTVCKSNGDCSGAGTCLYNMVVAAYGKKNSCSNSPSKPCCADGDCGGSATCVVSNEGIIIIKYLAGGRCSINQDVSCTIDQDCPDPLSETCTALTDWISRYDGPGQGDDRPSAIAFDQDGNVLVAGYVRDGTLNQDDLFVAKYCGSRACSLNLNKACGRDSDCDAVTDGTCSGLYPKCGGKDKKEIIWSNIYQGAGGGDNHATSLALDSYGNVYAAGYITANCANPLSLYTTESDCAATYCCSGAPYSTQSFCKAAGGIWGSCTWSTVSNQEWATIKYDGSNGNILWSRFYNGPVRGNDQALAVKVDPIDSNVVVSGTSLETSGTCSVTCGSLQCCSNYSTRQCTGDSDCVFHDFHVIRYASSDGSVLWENDLQGKNHNDSLVTSMAMDSSGYIYIAGNMDNGSNTDILSVIYDYNGLFLDGMAFDGSRCSDDYTKLCTTATQSTDCVSGTCLTGLSSTGGGDDVANAITVNKKGEAFIAGYSMNPYPNHDFLVLKQKNTFIMPAPSPFTATAVTNSNNNYNVGLSWSNNAKLCSSDQNTMCFVNTDCSNLSKGTCSVFAGVHIERASAQYSGLAQCPSPTDSGWTLIKTYNPGTAVSSSWTDTGLNNDPPAPAAALLEDANYCYRIESFTGALPASRKPSAAVTTTLRAPTNLSINASSIQTNGMTFTWDSILGPGPSPCQTPGSLGQNCTPASIYIVKYGTSSGSYPNSACSSTTSTSCTTTVLSPGTRYYFAAYDTDANGNSSFSIEVNAYTLPAPPTGLAVSTQTPPTPTTITLSWNVSGSNSTYTMYYGDANGGPYPNIACANTASTSCTVSDLCPNTTYYFVVQATNPSLGNSQLSSQVSGTTTSPAPSWNTSNWQWSYTPFSSITPTTITVNWNAVSGATGYAVYYGTTSGSYPNPGCTAGVGSTSCTVTGLCPNTTYYFVVVSSGNWCSQPAQSSEITNTTQSAIPTWQNGQYGQQPAISNITPTSLTANWNAVNDATGYTVYYGTTSGSYPNTACANTTSTSCSISDLTPGTQYFIVVTSAGSWCSKPSTSGETNAYTLPTTPTITGIAHNACSAVGNGSDTASISWSWDGAGIANGYYVEYAICNQSKGDVSQCASNSGESNWSTCSGTLDGTPCTQATAKTVCGQGVSCGMWQSAGTTGSASTNLNYSMLPGYAYRFRVFSTVDSGNTKSNPSTQDTSPAGSVWACMPPLKQNAITAISETQLQVNWTGIAGDSKYDIQRLTCSGACASGAGGPFLTIASGTWESTHLRVGTVINDGGTYKMWYNGYNGTNWQIGYATSSDGVTWTKYGSNPVLQIGTSGQWDSQYVYGPSVTNDGGTYKMWYSGYDGTNWQIGYATSSDGVTWTKYGSNPVLQIGASGQWDSAGAFAPSVINDSGTYKMWYAGNNGTNWQNLGYATSADGVSWTKYGSNPVLSRDAGSAWESILVREPAVINDGGTYKMWYSGYNGTNWQIGYATSSDGTSWTKYNTGTNANPVVGTGDWDSNGVIGSSVINDGGTYKMWYAGSNGSNWKTGYATSADGISWDKYICEVQSGFSTVASGISYDTLSWQEPSGSLSQVPSYAYKVRAYNTTSFTTNGPTPHPNDVWSNVQCKSTPPPAPKPLTLSNVTESQVQLSWMDNGGGKYNGYEMQRAAASQTNNPEYDGQGSSYWGSWTVVGNLIADWDFENASTSWTGAVGTSTGTSIDTSVYYNGAKSLKLTATGSTLGRSQAVTVTAGAQYVLSGYLKASLTSGRTQCDMYGTDIDSPGIGINWNEANNDGNWHYLTETVTIPSGTSSVNIRCFADGSPQGTAYFDYILFMPASIANLSELTYTDTGLTAGYGYKYQVRARYGSGLWTAWTDTSCSTSHSILTDTCARTIPSAPSGLTWLATGNPAQKDGCSASTSQITLSWTDVTGEAGYDLRYVQRGRCQNNIALPCTTSGECTSVGGNCDLTNCPTAGDWGTSIPLGENTGYQTGCFNGAANFYTFDVPSLNIVYCLEMRACRGYNCGTTYGYGDWSAVIPMIPYPTAPTLLNTPGNNTTSTLDLSWSSVSNATSYTVQQSTDNTNYSNATGCTGVTTTSCTATGLSSGTMYYFRVYATNSTGNSTSGDHPYSNVVNARTICASPTVSLNADSSSQITLSWNLVYQCSNYKIMRAVNTCNNDSTRSCCTSSDCLFSGTCTSGTYSPVYDDPITYQDAYCCSPNTCQTYPYPGCTTPSGLIVTYPDGSLTESVKYSYKVLAYNTDTNIDSADNIVCTRSGDVAAPTLVGTALSCREVKLTWQYDASSCSTLQPCRSDIDGVAIEMKLPNGQWSTIATTNSTTNSVIDKIGISPNGTYYYRARAFKNENGATIWSSYSTSGFCSGSGGSCSSYMDQWSCQNDSSCNWTPYVRVTTPPYSTGCTTCD